MTAQSFRVTNVLAVAAVGLIASPHAQAQSFPDAIYTASAVGTVTANTPVDSFGVVRGVGLWASTGLLPQQGVVSPFPPGPVLIGPNSTEENFPFTIAQMSAAPGAIPRGSGLEGAMYAESQFAFEVHAANPCSNGQTTGCDPSTATVDLKAMESVFSNLPGAGSPTASVLVDGPGLSYSNNLSEPVNGSFTGPFSESATIDKPLTVMVDQIYTVEFGDAIAYSLESTLQPIDFTAIDDPVVSIDPSTLDASDYSLEFSPGVGVGSGGTVPEPSALLLLVVGLGMLSVSYRIGKRRAS